MLIKRKKFSENILSNTYYPAQVLSDSTDYLLDTTENVVGTIDNSRIGQTPPVRKKTRMVRNVVSGIKAYLPRKHKKKTRKEIKPSNI